MHCNEEGKLRNNLDNISTSILTRTFDKEIGAMFGVANKVLLLVIMSLAETEIVTGVKLTMSTATK